MQSNPPANIEDLQRIAHAYRPSIILLAANQLGIFRTLRGQSLSADELAARLGIDLRGTRILLDALASLGIITKHGSMYSNAPVTELHLADESSEHYLGNWLSHQYRLLRRWVQLEQVVRSGKPARERESRDFRCFQLAMRDSGRRGAELLTSHFDFSPYRRLLDVGGGPGSYSIQACRQNPELRAVVFDLPEARELAESNIRLAGLEDRITFLSGDYFSDDLGGPYDVVLLSNVIHSLSPEETAQLLARCHQVLQPGGVILIRDFFLDEEGIHPVAAALFSVNMLVNTERGRSYTWDETEDLLRRSGFVVRGRRVLDADRSVGLVVGAKP